jgi:hypothetical protein
LLRPVITRAVAFGLDLAVQGAHPVRPDFDAFSVGANDGEADLVCHALFKVGAATGVYTDMIEAGILDPTKVVRSALQNASSMAGLMITTEAMAAELPKDDAPMGAPDIGGMGGMGGMM